MPARAIRAARCPAADLLACLYGAELNVWPGTVADPDRDRFVLSKGHAAPALVCDGRLLRLLRSPRLRFACAS